jgi:beta-alanine--pyruvate transaminase
MNALWMPFTSNRRYKSDPILFEEGHGMHYVLSDGRRILDSTAGLWCVNAGHGRDRITNAIAGQARRLQYVSTFQVGHPLAFEFAERLADLAPGDLDHVFFTNSGSESVDTALKMALAYHRALGQGGRTRLIGRERGYHGTGFGGISVGGIGSHRRPFGNLLSSVDHLPHTYNHGEQAFSRGEPAWGAHLADDLIRLIQLHDASTIAAVIVEPVAGSTGVLSPPVGYLKRLRDICDEHGILLIFDEVITGFGRIGHAFAAQRFGVQPDIVTCAKGLTNGAVPMGAVIAGRKVHEAIVQGPINNIEFPHGYTYSGHPLACAAGIATLDIYQEEGLFARCASLESYWADCIHSLKGPSVIRDIRTIGLLAAIELVPRPNGPGLRAYECMQRALANGLLVRSSGDQIILSPPLIIEKEQIKVICETLSEVFAGLD